MINQKLFNRKRQVLTQLAILGIVLVLSSFECAPKLKKLEGMKDEGSDKAIIESDIDCIDNSLNCFKIKLIRAESYLNMNSLEQAAIYSKEAIDRISPKVPPQDIVRVYSIRSSALFAQLQLITDVLQRNNMIGEIEKNFTNALDIAKQLPENKKNKDLKKNLLLKLIETFFKEMDISDEVYLESIYQKMVSSVEELEEILPEMGIGKYYDLKGEFRLVLPNIKKWMYGGKIQGDRERLLQHLKLIYKEGLSLRNLPVYQEGYAGQIDQFLTDVDFYMKQLVL